MTDVAAKADELASSISHITPLQSGHVSIDWRSR